MIYEADWASGATTSAALEALEDEGFLLPFCLTVTADQVIDAPLRQRLTETVAGLLSGTTNREIDIRFLPPVSADPEVWDRYYDGVEALLELLQAIDADLSRLSVVQRPALCLLRSRRADHFLEARLEAGAFRLTHYFDGYPVADVPATAGAMSNMNQRLLESEASADAANTTPYRRLMTGLLSPAPSPLGNDVCGVVARRRNRLWETQLAWLLRELLEISRENVALATPLRVDITPDRKTEFSPLYPQGPLT
ncbi:MAG: hypothetical protein AAF333_11565 [Planctomycetota bacterium]